MEKKKVLADLEQKFKERIKEVSSQFGDECLLIERDALVDVVRFLNETPYSFTMLLDLTCVDRGALKPRFEMVYHLFSLPNNQRLRIKARLEEKDLRINSLTAFWKNANWLEREVFDLFGVEFRGHPDMRRIFMYDGFEGYPLRKDYPLRKRQPRIQLRK